MYIFFPHKSHEKPSVKEKQINNYLQNYSNHHFFSFSVLFLLNWTTTFSIIFSIFFLIFLFPFHSSHYLSFSFHPFSFHPTEQSLSLYKPKESVWMFYAIILRVNQYYALPSIIKNRSTSASLLYTLIIKQKTSNHLTTRIWLHPNLQEFI